MKQQPAIVLVICLVLSGLGATGSANSLLLDTATAITWGDFSVQDVTADVTTEYFNPALMLEYRIGDEEKFGIGIGYQKSENDFDGEWDGGNGKHTEGEVSVERTIIDLYARLLAGPHFNLRLGYRNFQYEFTDGFLQKTQNGELIETAEDADANGDLAQGFDVEMNFIGGTDFQFRLGFGFSYFFGADYDWNYTRTCYNPTRTDHNSGSASHDAMAVRIKPEFTLALQENLRLTLDYTLAAAIWEGDTDQADIEDYPGIDIYSAFGIGIEFTMPFDRY